jgi:hypothetical protein
MFLLGTLFSANAQVPSYVPKDSLKGWYPFNGNANDLSGNGNNGTVNGATLTSDRFLNSNNAYDFNGSSNYILVNKTPFINAPFTISAWVNVKTFSSSPHHPIIGLGESGSNTIKRMYFSPNYGFNGTPSIGTGGAVDITTSSSSIQLNSWYHIVVTVTSFAPSGVKFYVNGVLLGINTTNGGTTPLPLNNSGFAIGKHSVSSGTAFFNGKIDDLGIWNRALTQQEVEDLSNSCNFAISTEPTNQSSNINSQAKFTSLASDTTASYQWQSNASNMGWSNVPSSSFYSGVTTKKLTVNNIKLKNHEQLFRVIATKNTCKDTSVVAMLTVNDTCITSTTDTLYIKVNTSSLSNPVYNTVKVYPNPSSTQIIIDNGNFSTMGAYTAKIVNSIGQQVFQSVINQQQFVIDANTMGGAGVYTLYITDGNNKVVGVKKIVLQ